MSGLIDYWHCFAADYAAARTRFRDAARLARAKFATYTHPHAKGPDGLELSVDVARVGPVTARRQLLAISGTHGLEGAAGSAVQVAWLSVAARALPDDTAVVLVHGLNPYGFAHGTRTTEHNVDLNRNFTDHEIPSYPANPQYAQLHPHLIPDQWDEETLAVSARAIDRFRDAHGPDALFNVLASGQYTHPEGLLYGGSAREWSNLTLQTIVHEHLAHAQRIGFIDWHTGIGEYGEPFFLCFNETGSAEHDEASRWWGRDRIQDQRPHGLARPDYQGLVFRGVEQFLNGRPMVGAVVEFGTRGRDTVLANRLDQWLRFKAPKHADEERDAMLRADVIDAFVPVSSIWRRSIIGHGVQITRQAIEGLATW
jgi:hypothetical protein